MIIFIVRDLNMKKSLWIPIVFVILMWVIFFIQYFYKVDLGFLGIHPQDSYSLIGIFTAPLIHGSWEHLLSNTIPIFIFGVILFISYSKIALRVWILIYVATGILVWLFARPDSYHIGASGIIYGLAAFLLFSGFFRMDIRSIAIASGVAIFYGGMIWGIFPLQPTVSWESHLFGGIIGIVLAFLYRHTTETTKNIERIEQEHKRKSFDDYMNQS
ncbi:MAG: hypothetical protein RJA25_613 [Bacteroidota bacterium]